jgi:hypothetical protein
LTAGLYGCQVCATFSLTHDSSKTTPTHVLHLGFLKIVLDAKKGTNTHCVLCKTGQMPIFSISSDASYDSGTIKFSSNNPLLENVVRADLLLANRQK